MSEYMEGTVVSEAECAAGLGFAGVSEFRRWKTKVGNENAELKHALRRAKDEARRFQWHVKRQLIVLRKAREAVESGAIQDQSVREKVLLAIDVVSGGGVDWDHVLKDWFKEATC